MNVRWTLEQRCVPAGTVLQSQVKNDIKIYVTASHADTTKQNLSSKIFSYIQTYKLCTLSLIHFCLFNKANRTEALFTFVFAHSV